MAAGSTLRVTRVERIIQRFRRGAFNGLLPSAYRLLSYERDQILQAARLRQRAGAAGAGGVGLAARAVGGEPSGLRDADDGDADARLPRADAGGDAAAEGDGRELAGAPAADARALRVLLRRAASALLRLVRQVVRLPGHRAG